MTEMFKIIDAFQAAYGRVYRYVDRTWWAWNTDEDCWEHLPAKARMSRAITNLVLDLFPGDLTLQRQCTRDYIQDRLIKGLVPGLSAATLPGRPFSQ